MLHTVYEEKGDILVFAGDEDETRIKEEELLADLTTNIKPAFDRFLEDTRKLGISLETKLIMKLT